MSAADFALCDECQEPVHVDEWDEHECEPEEIPGYDPAEPWMDPADIDDSDEEVGA